MSSSRMLRLFAIAAVLAAFVLTPLAFTPSEVVYLAADRVGFHDRGYVEMMYEPIKELIVTALIGWAVICGFWLPSRRRTPARLFSALFLLGVWISALFSVNLFLAVEEGIFLTVLALFPVFAPRFFSSKKTAAWGTAALCLGAVLAAGYTLHRLSGASRPLLAPFTAYERFRLADVLGHGRLTGLYLAPFLPLVVNQLFRNPQPALRFLSAVLLGVLCFVIAATAAPLEADLEPLFNPGWLAMATAAVALLFSLLFSLSGGRSVGKEGGNRSRRRAVLAALCFFFVAMMVVRFQDDVRREVREESASILADARQAAGETFLHGLGPGNRDVVFPYFHPTDYVEGWVYRMPINGGPDRYRLVLEWGALGCLAFLSLLGWLVLSGFREKPNTGSMSDPRPLIAGALALGTAALLGAPFASSGLLSLFWFLTGMAVVGVSLSRAPQTVPEAPGTVGLWRWVGVTVTLAVLAVYLGWVRFPDWMAGKEQMVGLVWIKGGAKANPKFRKALSLSPKRPQIRTDFAEYVYYETSENILEHKRIIAEKGRGNDFGRKALDDMAVEAKRLREVSEEALEVMPNEAANLFRLGMAYHFKAVRQDIPAMVAAWENAVRLSPRTPAFHNALAQVYITENQDALAMLHWEAALASDPSNLTALKSKAEYLYTHNRSDQAFALYQQVLDLLRSGERGTAEDLAQLEDRMEDLYGSKGLDRELLAGPLENRLYQLKETLRDNPGDLSTRFYVAATAERLAELYRKIGNVERSERMKKEALAEYRRAAAQGHKESKQRLIEHGD